jgi:hypothetical protein
MPRTVFVNPSRVRRRKRRKSCAPRRRRRRNAGITSFVSNPSLIQNPRRRRRHRSNPLAMNKLPMEVARLTLGATAGAMLNRIGISHITNFYARNLSRVAAAAGIAYMGNGSSLAAAAAGATLAPIAPEIEMQMAAMTKNPQELAAELAGLLEADLSDDDLSDDDDLEDELSW